MAPTEAIRQITHGGDVYSLMVFPDADRWLWFVTLTSTSLTDSTHWGRFLGGGPAESAQEAWKRAKSLAEQHRKAG